MSRTPAKVIDLALQGGGSHGALSWGVLDCLLADPRVEIASISGTSAGAMNAVVLADGLQRAGREGARESLAAFWQAVSAAARFSPIQRGWWDRLTDRYGLDHNPAYLLFEQLTRQFSPYQLNPLDINPLRDLLAERVDFDRVNCCDLLRVFVTATNVRTGRARTFTQPELSVDTLMASACLPFLFRAVEIDGEAYWDGGYIGNPALYPLVEDTATRDLLVVQINPMQRDSVPRSGREIVNRLNEITFNASLVKELRAIELLHRLIESEGLDAERRRAVYVHLIHADEALESLDASSKLNAEWGYLCHLRDIGQALGQAFLQNHYEDLGQRSSFDPATLFADSFRPPDCGGSGKRKQRAGGR
jgi:NTE family protein